MTQKRVAVAAGAAAGLALALLSPARPARHVVHLPVVRGPSFAPRPIPVAPTPLVERPADAASLRIAVTRRGRLVLPEPGVYKTGSPLRMAPGVTLDGRGGVEIRGGISIDGSSDVTISGLSVSWSPAGVDAIGINHLSGRATIDKVDLTGAGDGLLDVIRSPGGVVVIRDSVLHDDDKCMLLGHFDEAGDDRLLVSIERTRFVRCGARTPKVHRASVLMTDSVVEDWGSRAVDVQLGGLVKLRRVRFAPGPSTRGPSFREESGGRIQIVP